MNKTNTAANLAFSAGGEATSVAVGAAFGSAIPIAGTVAGAVLGFFAGVIYMAATETEYIDGKSIKQYAQEGVYYLVGQG